MAPEHMTEAKWHSLEKDYPADLVKGVRNKLERADSSIIDPELLGPSFKSDVDTTIRLLKEVAALGLLATEVRKFCGNCGVLATEEDQHIGICPNCTRRYEELDTPFKSELVFKLPKGRQSRDISWVVTAHGMNTDGAWQQDFSWLIANKLKYSAPVLILKYPLFRVMVLFERTQRWLVADLGARLQTAIDHARQRGDELKNLPDVVLHSYGTLLFSRLLLDPRFETLRFGRVILAGSIVRPDYDWNKHIGSGRIEEVVNHCGDKDWVVGIAQYFIPGSGPSGRRGFIDKAVRNVMAVDFGHGTFFDVGPMRANLAHGGAWDRFLTYPAIRLAGSDEMDGPTNWSGSGAAIVIRALAKLLAIIGLGPIIWFVMQIIAAIKVVTKVVLTSKPRKIEHHPEGPGHAE